MAEPKRIAVTQIGAAKPKEKVEKRRYNHRFTLSLVDSTEKTCPEFSFVELMKNALGDEKEGSGDDEDDPFAGKDRAEHDKLLAIAKSFEEKYALPKMGNKKKKKGSYNRVQEFVDLGDGYDETDPFIDNAEAYDELVPSCLTTQHGGFYINSGKLDFRVVSDSENEFVATPKKKRKKGNQITSDQESSDEASKKRGPKKKFKDGDEMKKIRKRKKLSSSELSDKPFLKKKKFEKDKLKSLKMKKKTSSTVADLLSTSTPTNGAGPTHSPVPKKHEALSDGGDMSQDGDDSRSCSPTPSGPAPSMSAPELVPRLPDNLPVNIQTLVANLKKAAHESEQGKCKFFTPKVNGWLLEIENTSRQMKCGWTRSIYNHLSAYLPCGNQTLIKRAKKLRLDQNDDKLREPLTKLKEAIGKVMPALTEKHQAELRAVQLQKIDRLQQSGSREVVSTESDDEGDKPDGEKQKRLMAPRRKFEWTNEMRSLLNSIVRIKMEHYDLAKVRKQSAEEYLKSFMESELKPLWPQGWMHERILFKESQGMHNRWTALGSKPRKPLTLQASGSSKPSTPVGSKPSTPVNAGGSTVCLTTTTTVTSTPAATSAATTATLTPSVFKDYKQISSSGSSSSDSSFSSNVNSPVREASTTLATVPKRTQDTTNKSLLDYAADSYSAIAKSKADSTSATDLSKKAISISTVSASTPKPPVDLKAAGSLGFATSSVDMLKPAKVTLQKIPAALSQEQMLQGVSVQENSQILNNKSKPVSSAGQRIVNVSAASSKLSHTPINVDRPTSATPKSSSTTPKQSANTIKPAFSSEKPSSSQTVKPAAKQTPKTPVDEVTRSFLENFYKFATGGSADREEMAKQISQLSGKVTNSATKVQTQSNVHASSAGTKQSKSAHVSQPSQQKPSNASSRPTVTTVTPHAAPKPSAAVRSQVTNKPALAAALQGKYFPTSQSSPSSAATATSAPTKPAVAGVVPHKPAVYAAALAQAASRSTANSISKSPSSQVSSSYKDPQSQSQRHSQVVTSVSKAHQSLSQVLKAKSTESPSGSHTQKQSSSQHQQNSGRSKAADLTAVNVVKQVLSSASLPSAQAKVAAASLLAGLNKPTTGHNKKPAPAQSPGLARTQVANNHTSIPKTITISPTSQPIRNNAAAKSATPLSVHAVSHKSSNPTKVATFAVPQPKSTLTSHFDHVSSTSNLAAAAAAAASTKSPVTSNVTADHRPKPTSAFSPTSRTNSTGHNLHVTSPPTTAKPQYQMPTSSAVSSTSGDEPKFGGMTLSQIQAQTLKASQKAHIQSAPQASGTLYRPEATKATSPYGGLYGTSPPSRGGASVVPKYGGGVPPPAPSNPPASPTARQGHEQGRPGYNLQRSPQTVGQHNNSLSNLYPSVPLSPNSGLSPYGHPFTDPSKSHHQY